MAFSMPLVSSINKRFGVGVGTGGDAGVGVEIAVAVCAGAAVGEVASVCFGVGVVSDIAAGVAVGFVMLIGVHADRSIRLARINNIARNLFIFAVTGELPRYILHSAAVLLPAG